MLIDKNNVLNSNDNLNIFVLFPAVRSLTFYGSAKRRYVCFVFLYVHHYRQGEETFNRQQPYNETFPN